MTLEDPEEFQKKLDMLKADLEEWQKKVEALGKIYSTERCQRSRAD